MPTKQTWQYPTIDTNESKKFARVGTPLSAAYETIGFDGTEDGGLRPFPGFMRVHTLSTPDGVAGAGARVAANRRRALLLLALSAPRRPRGWGRALQPAPLAAAPGAALQPATVAAAAPPTTLRVAREAAPPLCLTCASSAQTPEVAMAPMLLRSVP